MDKLQETIWLQTVLNDSSAISDLDNDIDEHQFYVQKVGFCLAHTLNGSAATIDALA